MHCLSAGKIYFCSENVVTTAVTTYTVGEASFVPELFLLVFHFTELMICTLLMRPTGIWEASDFFLCFTFVTNEHFIFIIYPPNLKFTIFIIYYTYDAFDIAESTPSSVQDT